MLDFKVDGHLQINNKSKFYFIYVRNPPKMCQV